MSAGAAGLGVAGAVRRVVNLPPAVAMRPEPPANYRPTIIERIGLQRFFSQTTRMILRHLERHPFKSLISSLGIALAVAILVVGNFSKDSVNFLMDFQFGIAERHDVAVSLVEADSDDALREISHLPGVIRAEPFVPFPRGCVSGTTRAASASWGSIRMPALKRLIDKDGRHIPLPPEGLMLSSALADRLGVKPGELVTVEVLEGVRPVRRVPVNGLITEYSGLWAYMERGALNRLMREGPSLSGAHVSADPAHVGGFYRRLKEIPGIAGVSEKRAALESFRKTMAENLLMMRLFMILFASIIACGVVYNSARIWSGGTQPRTGHASA